MLLRDVHGLKRWNDPVGEDHEIAVPGHRVGHADPVDGVADVRAIGQAAGVGARRRQEDYTCKRKY